MAEVDVDALVSGGKALNIIFILLIVPINVGLIIKIVLRNLSKFRFLSDPKKMTIISLAFGDMVLAIFTLVVHATVLFEGADNLTCKIRFLSDMYGASLLNFVHGTGLVVLGVKLILRMLRSSTGGQSFTLLAVIISALPWILGLLNVLPLTIAPMNWDTCKLDISNNNMQRAWYIVSICIPASLALLVSIFTHCVTQRITPAPFYPPVTHVSSQNPITNTRPDSHTKNMPLQLTIAPGYNNSHQYPQASYPYPQPHPRDATPTPQCTHPAQHQLSNNPESVYTYIPDSTYNLPPAPTNFGKEKATLFVICLVYFTCTIPNAGFYLGYVLDENRQRMDEMALTVMANLFYWLTVCRSALTPLIWICRLDD